MNTIRPNLNKKSAFDALLETKFTFTYSGNQVLKNELVIRNNITNEIIYQETITSFQLFHLLPADTLQNGISYNAELRVYDSNDNTSAWSNTIVFTCLKTPTFRFNNLTPNQIIGNPSYEFTLDYSQENGEPLNSTIVSLYYNGVEKFNTGQKHGDKLLSTTINALEDNSQYQIRATGETLNGLVVDTGLVSFSVEYIEPSLFAIVDLENICPTGEIRIQSNIKSIIGISNPYPPKYNNGSVVLTKDIEDNSNSFLIPVSISMSKWNRKVPYTQTIYCDGILESGYHIINPILSSDIEIAKKEMSAWSCIDRIDIYDGKIEITSSNNYPDVDLNIEVLASTSDVNTNDSWVEFNEGFSISSDFTLQIRGNNLTKYSTILTMGNKKNRLELIYMHGTFNQMDCAYFVLKAYNSITNYYQTSNYINIPSKYDVLDIDIRKINHTYQVTVKNQNV